jgi:hypothetical protein
VILGCSPSPTSALSTALQELSFLARLANLAQVYLTSTAVAATLLAFAKQATFYSTQPALNPVLSATALPAQLA